MEDQVCGLELLMQNPTAAEKRKRQNESISMHAVEIKFQQDCQASKRPTKTTNFMPQEMALDGKVEVTNNGHSSGCRKSTGDDTNTNEVKMVASDIYKLHLIQSSYNASVPIYVDPTNTDQFFFITTGRTRLWAKEKLACDSTGSKVVTVNIPPKASGTQWLSQAQQSKRTKAGTASNSSLCDMALMSKEVFGPIAQPPLNPPKSIMGLL
ncbi:hypothetical protein DFH28DRAFT_932941 [Melampsora americana]|nr:hypothetical protein DFH28DRAFT_932941 [Melampsora americana]